ncbi:hypothetical protein GPALN_013205 [Globodera pallida]|nr:hypothetical protein GPALN_013205 [Globodera pallida]
MSKAKNQFEKGYIPNYGDEILEIDAVKRHMKPTRYKLRDGKGEKFKGFFYNEELAPVRKEAETTFRSLTSVENLKQFLNDALKRQRPPGPDVVLTEEYPRVAMPEFINQRRKRAAPTSPPRYVAPKSPQSAVPGEYAEKIYDSPLYARVLPKEVSEIEIELRTMSDGRLVPFSFGTVMIVVAELGRNPLTCSEDRRRINVGGEPHKLGPELETFFVDFGAFSSLLYDEQAVL